MFRGDRRSGTINGALSTLGYLLSLLWELSHVPRGLTEDAEAKQVRKTNRTDILYQIGKMVRKSILTFRCGTRFDLRDSKRRALEN